jgi:hypothetical protein
MKVYNLEKFAKEQIYNPYRNKLDERYTKLSTPIPRDLEHATYHLMNVPEWRELVLNRLKEIDITFPSYMQHTLVTYLEDRI